MVELSMMSTTTQTRHANVVRNDSIELTISADGMDVTLEDRRRGKRWMLDPSTRLAASGIERYRFPAYAHGAAPTADGALGTLGPGRVTRLGETTLHCLHDTPAGTVSLRWDLLDDGVRVTCVNEGSHPASAVTLPGTFRPEADSGFLAAVPNCQGILHTGKGPAFYSPLFSFGHGSSCTMPMFGQIAGKAGLLTITLDEDDASLHWEKTTDGQIKLMWLQHPSLQQLRYDRQTLLKPVDGDVTSICKAYRRHIQSAGRFKSWDEKIAERPVLEKLFGSALVFIGYLHDDKLDYADSFRRLKAMGIDKAMVYPTYCNTTMSIEQGLGVRMIDIRQHQPVLDELGYLSGSFIYIMDGPAGDATDPNRDLMLDPNGKPMLAWKMKELEWYQFGTDARLAWARRMIDNDHAGLSMVHFDVATTRRLHEDYHPGHTCSAGDDRTNRQAMLKHATSKGLIVSSEGFWGRMTSEYDIGNTKYPFALGGEAYCVVPMTMLVYHDSAIHTWWEVDNYNNPHHQTQGGRGWRDQYAFGGGRPRQQAAMDALLGAPPDIFPFGLQYNFVPENNPQIYTYRFHLGKTSVQQAIAAAIPVMKLHERIGRLEMAEHHLHHPQGAVQQTVFADGTSVMVNFANVVMDAPGVGPMQPESWCVVSR